MGRHRWLTMRLRYWLCKDKMRAGMWMPRRGFGAETDRGQHKRV